METRKLNEDLARDTSLYVRDDQAEKRKKAPAKKTSLQREKEEKNARRNELQGQLRQVLAEQEEVLRAGGNLEAGDSTGYELEHRKFGVGKVISCRGRFFTIRFAAKEIRMQLPDAFDKGLLTIPEGSGADGERIEEICRQCRELEDRKTELEEKAKEIGLQIADLGA